MGHQPRRSKFAVSDARASSSNRGTTSIDFPKQSKRVPAAKGVRRLIGKVTNKLTFVTRDERSQSSSAATAESPTNSTDDVQGSNVVPDGDLSSSSTGSPSPSLPRSRGNSSRKQGKVSIAQNYRILPEVTGRGIDGEVRRCIHLRSSELCAVKTIRKDCTQQKHRIFREIAFLNQVRHPNIIEVRDVYEDEDEINIVMEMCHGGELFDKITEKAERSKKSKIDGADRRTPSCFREKDAARIVHSLLLATSYLHSKDIVHRDIKPDNILFVEKDDDESPIKLIDFGLSVRHTQHEMPLTTRVGSHYYMAPEVLKGCYDRSCDLWSIGVVAYILLSGHAPFNGQSEDVIFRKIRRGFDHSRMNTSDLWDGISEYAKDFIRCLLVSNPTGRWTADMALEHPWLKIERLGSKERANTIKEGSLRKRERRPRRQHCANMSNNASENKSSTSITSTPPE